MQQNVLRVLDVLYKFQLNSVKVNNVWHLKKRITKMMFSLEGQTSNIHNVQGPINLNYYTSSSCV